MRGGRDRDRLGDRVDAVGAAGGEDGREALLPHARAEVPGVQVHVLGAPLVGAPHDRLGDDVARGQLGEFVLSGHEADAVGVHQVGALAAYRFRDERLLPLRVRAEVEDRRVELDEFEVGDLGAGAQREGHAVARGDGRVGGRGEDLAHAAGREDDRGGAHGAHAVVLALAHHVQGDAGGASFGVGEQVEDERVLDGAQALGAYGVDQGAGDLGAGRVAARVRYAAAVVPALAGEGYLVAAGRGVEARAGGDEAADGVRAFGDQGAYGVLVAQPGARHEGVGQVLLGGVALAERGRDAALGPARGAVVQAGLGHHDGAAARGGAAQGGGQARDSRTDHDDIGLDGPAGGGGLEAEGGVVGGGGHVGAGRAAGVVVTDGVVVADGAGAGHRGAPNVRRMLSMRRVVPTLAATARTASPS